jgi:WS/DGAT/MGAT family acyltransferase
MPTQILRLSALDLINFAVEAPDTPMHLGALAVLDGGPLYDDRGRLRLAQIRAEIDRRFAGVPQLRGLVHHPGPLAGRPVWANDPAFQIDRQVDAVALPPPADEPAMLRLVEDLIAGPMDRSRPLWRMWFVTGLPAGQVAVVILLHHAIADGLAAVGLVTSLLDSPLAAGPALEPPSAAVPPRWPELVRDNARARLVAVGRRLAHLPSPRLVAGSLRARWRVFARCRGATRTSLNAPIGPRRRLGVLRLDLATVRQVAHAHDSKINDVVLDLAAGGLRELLDSRGEPVDGQFLRAAVATSLRTSQQVGGAGNRTGVIVVRLPLGEADPRVRLRLVSADSRRAKHDQLPTTSNGLLVWLARLGLIRHFTRRQRLTNLIESNLAGPPAPISILGAPVVDLVPIGNLAGNLAVSFLALSYTGRLTIAVQADADRFPDLPVLMAAMERDWDSLCAPPVTFRLLSATTA